MKKLPWFIILFLILPISLNAEVYKTTKKITAYKEIGSSSSSQDVANVTLTLLEPSATEGFNDGSIINIPKANRNVEYLAFKWELTGNLYNNVTLSFLFSPMYLGVMSDYSAITTVSETNAVIPYQVVLSHTQSYASSDGSTYSAISANVSATRNQSTAIDTGLTQRYGWTNYAVRANYSDAYSITSPSKISTTSINNGKITYDMSSNSIFWYGSFNDYSYTSSTCNQWKRAGQAVVTLLIDEDGYWIDDRSIVVDPGSYKAYVTITVSTE